MWTTSIGGYLLLASKPRPDLSIPQEFVTRQARRCNQGEHFRGSMASSQILKTSGGGYVAAWPNPTVTCAELKPGHRVIVGHADLHEGGVTQPASNQKHI